MDISKQIYNQDMPKQIKILEFRINKRIHTLLKKWVKI